jgi:lactoylglutathione lyase
MTLYGHANRVAEGIQIQHYFLGFSRPNATGECHLDNILCHPDTLLELLHRPGQTAPKHTDSSVGKAGYWKIGITLGDVDLAREYLVDSGMVVSEPRQFLDIGYLCHLNDPDGYSIELLQHRFSENHQPCSPQPNYNLRSIPTFGQITLRIKDPDKSLNFYTQGFGMRLLSRQIVEAYRFTLYFLAYTEEQPPFPDIDDVRNREWLWQRPYTVLELQHVWGTENGTVSYRTTPDTGFERISIATSDLESTLAKLIDRRVHSAPLSQFDDSLSTNTVTVLDPDGYSVRIVEASEAHYC